MIKAGKNHCQLINSRNLMRKSSIYTFCAEMRADAVPAFPHRQWLKRAVLVSRMSHLSRLRYISYTISNNILLFKKVRLG